MNLFTEQINNEQDWENVYQSISSFAPLVNHIMKKEKLPSSQIENLTPGTNAVFKVGEYVIKIFAPEESGFSQSLDIETELFATRRANKLGVSAPKLIAHDHVEDKFHFTYIITEYINGMAFEEALKIMTDCEKTDIARKLRIITDKMNTPCEPFNSIDVINDKGRYHSWEKYPEYFKAERLAYMKSYNYGDNVFVHGDLCLDNMLLTSQGELYIIDFADAVLAPKIYEHAIVALAFGYISDIVLLRGYFEDYSADEFTEMCFNGLLLHDLGGQIVEDILGKPNEFQTLNGLRKTLKSWMEKKN